MKRYISLFLALVMALSMFAFAGCEKKEEGGSSDLGNDPIKVVMEVKGHGAMTIELYPDIAPISVENFVNYVKDGFYDGLTFHRIYKGFMIQGGDNGDNSLTPIKGEFASNGVENNLSHKRGVISMARTNEPNSATSQFFICDADSTFLDGNYAAFGMVIEGFETLDSIASVEVKANFMGEMSDPIEDVIIERVYIAE